MKAVIVTNSSSYEPRADKIEAFLKTYGYQVTLLESDFIHREKVKGREPKSDHIYIDTIPYKRNLSLKRLYSHYNFAVKASKQLELMDIDLLYVMIPANSLAKFAAQYKQKHNVKLILDIIDLWPESLPLKHVKSLWPIRYWRNLRDNYLSSADMVLTECNLYQEILREHVAGGKVATVYWPKHKAETRIEFKPDDNYMHICYLGAINNIIDISFIVEILKKVNEKEKIVLHVIGDGENKDKFLEEFKLHHIKTIYHGAVYGEQEKQDIFNLCSYGINIMKDSVCVGVTMKSVDYMCAGIPLINNIKGDTRELIEKYQIGVNCNPLNIDAAVEKILYGKNCMEEYRKRVRQVYLQVFSEEAFENTLKKCLAPLWTEQEVL